MALQGYFEAVGYRCKNDETLKLMINSLKSPTGQTWIIEHLMPIGRVRVYKTSEVRWFFGCLHFALTKRKNL